MKNGSLMARLRSMDRRPKMLLSLGLVVVLALLAVGFLREPTGAEGVTAVGYVDWSQIQAHYLKPQLNEPLTELSQLQQDLQAEFDEKAEGLEDEEKQELFDQYQERLDKKVAEVQALEEQYVTKALEAVASQAKKQGVSLVLHKEAVLDGGIDLTPAVLQALGVDG